MFGGFFRSLRAWNLKEQRGAQRPSPVGDSSPFIEGQIFLLPGCVHPIATLVLVLCALDGGQGHAKRPWWGACGVLE